MDTVTWDKGKFQRCLESELGIRAALFVGNRTSGESIKSNILKECKGQWDLSINSDNFLKFFKIQDSNFKILKSVRKEVKMFQDMKEAFKNLLNHYQGQDQVDLVFEFQAYMR